VKKAHHGGSLAPKKSPGPAPKSDEKATKLLEGGARPLLQFRLQARRDYMHALTGLSVRRSTTCCHAVARIGSNRKKGDDPQRSATSSEEPPSG
jgi:hypothetical protein